MKLDFLFGRVSYYNLVRKISLASPSQHRIAQDHLFDLTQLVKLGYLRSYLVGRIVLVQSSHIYWHFIEQLVPTAHHPARSSSPHHSSRATPLLLERRRLWSC